MLWKRIRLSESKDWNPFVPLFGERNASRNFFRGCFHKVSLWKVVGNQKLLSNSQFYDFRFFWAQLRLCGWIWDQPEEMGKTKRDQTMWFPAANPPEMLRTWSRTDPEVRPSHLTTSIRIRNEPTLWMAIHKVHVTKMKPESAWNEIFHRASFFSG